LVTGSEYTKSFIAALLLLIFVKSSAPAEDKYRDMKVGEQTRCYLVHVPGECASRPLIINMHGWGCTPEQQQKWSQLDAVADREGFLVAYPKAREPGLLWDPPRDVRFIWAMIEQIHKDYGIEPKRVYATGFSAGGFMANYLGNVLSDRIAAIVPVEGGFLDWQLDRPKRGVPVALIHNRHDKTVPYASGVGARDQWIKWNGCDSTVETIVTNVNPRVTLDRYGSGRNNSSVCFYTFHYDKGDGHVLPWEKECGINLSETTGAFFKGYSLFAVPTGEPDFPPIEEGDRSKSTQRAESDSVERPFLITAVRPGWQVIEAEDIGWRVSGEATRFELEGSSGGKLLAIWDAGTSIECAFEASGVEVYAFSHEGRADHRIFIDRELKSAANNSDTEKVCDHNWPKRGKHILRIAADGIVGVDYIRLRK
jgi:polyhydroxybutyrate depolymerase